MSESAAFSHLMANVGGTSTLLGFVRHPHGTSSTRNRTKRR